MSLQWLSLALFLATTGRPTDGILPFKLKVPIVHHFIEEATRPLKDHLLEDHHLVEQVPLTIGELPLEAPSFASTPYGYVPEKFVNAPVCPLYVKKVWEEEVVEQVVHSLVTVWESAEKTEFLTVTETLKYPVTVIDRTTVTVPAKPIFKTETVIVPEEKTVMSARVDTVEVTITQTSLEVITFTLTNTITSTSTEAEWITMTEYETSWQTVSVPVTSTSTVWTQEVEMVTQPVYVTTNLWVEAPQLSLITSTEYVAHYMTQTSTVTTRVVTTVCPRPKYGDKFN